MTEQISQTSMNLIADLLLEDYKKITNFCHSHPNFPEFSAQHKIATQNSNTKKNEAENSVQKRKDKKPC